MDRIKGIKKKTNGSLSSAPLVPFGTDGILVDMLSGLDNEQELKLGGNHTVSISTVSLIIDTTTNLPVSANNAIISNNSIVLPQNSSYANGENLEISNNVVVDTSTDPATEVTSEDAYINNETILIPQNSQYAKTIANNLEINNSITKVLEYYFKNNNTTHVDSDYSYTIENLIIEGTDQTSVVSSLWIGKRIDGVNANKIKIITIPSTGDITEVLN